MKKTVIRIAVLLFLLAGLFALLDLLAGGRFGAVNRFHWPHFLLAASVLLISYSLISLSLDDARRSEALLRQAHDELESRVAERTAELERTNETLVATKLQAETEKRHLEALLQALPVGVVITDDQGGVVLTNGMDDQIWGQRPVTHGVNDYAQYQAWWVDSGKPVEPHEWASARAIEKGESVYGQVLQIQRFDGGRGFILNSAVPIRDAEGRVTGSVVAIQDITGLRRAEQALRQSEELLRTIVDHSRDGINMLDLKTMRYVFMSPAQVKLSGFSAEELRDLTAEEAYERVHPDDREIPISQQRELAAGQDHDMRVEYRWKVKSGEYRWFSDSRALVRDEQGQAIALVGVSRDITDQKRAEEALRTSEEKYRLLFQNMAEGFALYELLYDQQGDPVDWRVLEVNDAYTRHTGVSRDQIVGFCASELFPSAIPEYLWRFVTVVATQTPMEFETHARIVDRYQRVRTFPAGGHRFASIVEDITARKQSEEALRRAQAALTLDTRRRTSLEERQRLARELHDSVSQAIYGISLGVHTALALVDKDRAKTHEALEYALAMAHAALTEMRALIFELRPESLEKEGLVAALAKQVEAVRVRHHIEVDVSLCDEPDVPLWFKEGLYRIAQEALQNAVKHARPEKVVLRLVCEQEGLRLEVCDDGVGFDPTAEYAGHLGLRSMQERAVNLGGTLKIVSAQDCGAQILVDVPVPGSAQPNLEPTAT